VTFLFTDIEGSTRLLQRLGDVYASVLTAHQQLLRAAFAAHGGVEVDTQGDAFFVAFPSAPQAVAAAAAATQALAAHVWPQAATLSVRIGLHTGTPQLVGDHYVGLDVHRAARIAAAGHGGQILLSAATAELARHNLPDSVSLRDLGTHRLKDLQQAERIYQVVLADLPTDFPQLKAFDARPHNLPVQPSALVGREREVAEVNQLLRREDVRLVTLTGPGGIGKTRLSLQVAAETLDAFPDGVWSVQLARLSDPELVVPTIATTLDLKESGGVPLGDVLRGYLRDKRLLLVLDNFEQVAAAAAQVGELLASCIGVRALVTSRVALRLRGEHEYALHPLALPDLAHLPPLERLSQYAAVALFIERAQAAQADFTLTNQNALAVAAICSRLDGLPLAIELAAARIKLLPPTAILHRLERSLSMLTGGARDLEERQQTLHATLAWSEELLSFEERRLFRRLAVFVGGFTLEAVEAVCAAPGGAEPLGVDVLEALGRLVDHSLVLPWRAPSADTDGADEHDSEEAQRNEARFRLLYVVREYALEQLEANTGSNAGHEVHESRELAALRRAHAAYYVALTEQAWTATYGDALADYRVVRAEYERLECDQDNLRVALAWLQASAKQGRSASTGKADHPQAPWKITLPASGLDHKTRGGALGDEAPVAMGLRLTGALLWVWAFSGQLREGRTWLEAFVALDQEVTSETAQRKAQSADVFPAHAGQSDQPDQPGSADGADHLTPHGERRRWKQSASPRAASEAAARGRALYALGVLTYWQGDIDQAVPLLQRSLMLTRAAGDHVLTDYVLNNLGMAFQDQGDVEQARVCYEECLAQLRARGVLRSACVGNALSDLASLAFVTGDLAQAETYAEEAVAVCRQVHFSVAAAQSRCVQTLLAWWRGDMRRAEALAGEALALGRSAKDVRLYADGLEVCAIIRATQGQPEQAARLLGAATASRERIGMRRPLDMPVAMADTVTAAVGSAQAALGEATWNAAFAAGQALSLEQAIAEALGEDRENG